MSIPLAVSVSTKLSSSERLLSPSQDAVIHFRLLAKNAAVPVRSGSAGIFTVPIDRRHTVSGVVILKIKAVNRKSARASQRSQGKARSRLEHYQPLMFSPVFFWGATMPEGISWVRPIHGRWVAHRRLMLGNKILCYECFATKGKAAGLTEPGRQVRRAANVLRAFRVLVGASQ